MPFARVGVIGGGQLARMMHQPAIALGIELVVLTEDRLSGAGTVGRYLEGRPDDERKLRELAGLCDIVTVDHEVLDLELLSRLQSEGIRLLPNAETLAVAADKLAQRRCFEEAGLPIPEWRLVREPQDVAAAMDDWGEVVLKLARGGYDGRGVWIRPDRHTALEVVTAISSRGGQLILERAISTEVELTVLVVRSPSGEMVTYDPVLTHQHDGQCREVNAPAPISAAIATSAVDLAGRVAESLGSIGVLAVEIFVDTDRVLVNEVAPRPHNSGHHTIDAAITSQFENHLRAVLDLPLGDTALRSGAATVNLIAIDDTTDPRRHLSEGMTADPGAKIHLYDKAPRRNRKVGHVTVCDDDITRASIRAWKVVKAMGGMMCE